MAKPLMIFFFLEKWEQISHINQRKSYKV